MTGFVSPTARVLSLPFECLESMPGGLSEVRKWRDPLLDCERVGKRVDLMGADPSVVPEAATLQAIDHPNVLKVVTAARVSGYARPMDVIEIVTPYYPLGSVTDALIRGETFAASEAIEIMRTSLLGLEHLHEVHNLCHRDVKSGNILLEAGPRGIIADIGLAGQMDSSGQVDSLENPTLYTAPEFATSGRVGKASDIYSMGLVLRELLGGAFNYASYSRSDVLTRLARGRPVISPAELSLPVWSPASLRRAYAKATNRDPAKRFRTAREFSVALDRVVVLDWVQLETGTWEAPPKMNRPFSTRVEATPARGGFDLSLRVNRGRGWRRIQADIRSPAVDSADLRRLFDRANTI